MALSTPITVTFNQAVQSSTIVFTLTNEFGNSVAGTVTYNSSTVHGHLYSQRSLAGLDDLHGHGERRQEQRGRQP